VILRGLLRRRTRTLLTVAGVAIGVAAIVALGGLAEGLSAGYGALGGGSGADLLVAQADAVDIVFSAVDEEVGAALDGMAGVEQVTGMVYTFAATEGMPYFIVFGYDPQGFAIEHFRIVEGEGLSGRDAQRGGRPLLLGRAAAEDLERQVGDTLRLYETVYRIVGIYETGSPFEDGAAVVRLEDGQQISHHPRQVNAFLVRLEHGDALDQVRERINRRFEDVTATLSSTFAQEQETLAMIDGFTWGVSFLAILIGGVGVMNTMLMSVFERTREFGALRAVGWQRWRVLFLVLGESLALSGLGGLVGAGVGVLAVEGLRQVPMAGAYLGGEFSPALFAQALGVALLLGLVGGGYPAWRASRLLPAEAMRAESGGGMRVPRLRFGGTALRNLLRQPARTSLTLVGIGIALMAMVSLGALADGLVAEMENVMGGNVHLVGMEAGASIDLSTVDERTVRHIANLPGVEHAEGFLTGYAVVGDLPFFVVFGYPPRGYGIRDFRIVEGQPLAANRQILLGRVAAENLDREVGETLRLFDTTFRVVGIYETGVAFEDGGGVISLHDAQSLFGQPRKVSFLGIRLEHPAQAEEVIRRVESRFPEISLSEAADFAEDVSDLQYMRASTWAIALLALVVGGAGMMNTMVMSVFERTREIGVLRALGWGRARVLAMIMGESVALSLLGGVVGSAAGVGLSLLLNRTPFMSGLAQARFSSGLFVQALVTALVLGAVGGIYPAWRASRLQPVEALRYE
jgi:ABC-type antimicrobial peptide transport system permease subunit